MYLELSLLLTAAKGPWTVEKVVDSMPGGAPASHTESPVPFFHVLERLKTTKREGWRRFGIDRYMPT
jgi:putative hydrolase of HD superfamily